MNHLQDGESEEVKIQKEKACPEARQGFRTG